MKSDVHVKQAFKRVLPNNESGIDRAITMKTKVRGNIFSLIIQISAWISMTMHLTGKTGQQLELAQISWKVVGLQERHTGEILLQDPTREMRAPHN